MLMTLFDCEPTSKKAALVFGPPGSGKSTTVKVAANMVNSKYCRIKLRPNYGLHGSLSATCNQIIVGDKSYHQCKNTFQHEINAFIAGVEADIDPLRTAVVHLDEAQVLMGEDLITRGVFDSMSILERSKLPMLLFAFSMLRDGLNDLMLRWPSVYIVISGTNAFSGLVLNTGSELKVERITLIGRFRVDWLLCEIIDKYFNISLGDMQQVVLVLDHVSASRRCCWFFICALFRILQSNLFSEKDLVAAALECVLASNMTLEVLENQSFVPSTYYDVQKRIKALKLWYNRPTLEMLQLSSFL